MRSLYKQVAAVLIFTVLSGCAAPLGPPYGTDDFYRAVLGDPCALSFVNKPDVLAWLNTSIGKPSGVSEKVIEIRNSSYVQLKPPHSLNSSLACHSTLVFSGGNTANGTFAFIDKVITWTPDFTVNATATQKNPAEKTLERFEFSEQNLLALKSVKAPKIETVPAMTADQAKEVNKAEFKSALSIANYLGNEIFDVFAIAQVCDLRSEKWEIETDNFLKKSMLNGIASFNLTHKQFESVRARMDKVIAKKEKGVNGKSKNKVCQREGNSQILSDYDMWHDQAIADQVLPAVPRSLGFGLALKNAKETGEMMGEISFVTSCQLRSQYWENTLNMSLMMTMTQLDAKLTAEESDYVQNISTIAMSRKVGELQGPMGLNMIRNCQREVDSPSLQALDKIQYEATGNYH